MLRERGQTLGNKFIWNKKCIPLPFKTNTKKKHTVLLDTYHISNNNVPLTMIGNWLLVLIAQDEHVIFQGNEVQILIKYLHQNKSKTHFNGQHLLAFLKENFRCHWPNGIADEIHVKEKDREKIREVRWLRQTLRPWSPKEKGWEPTAPIVAWLAGWPWLSGWQRLRLAQRWLCPPAYSERWPRWSSGSRTHRADSAGPEEAQLKVGETAFHRSASP